MTEESVVVLDSVPVFVRRFGRSRPPRRARTGLLLASDQVLAKCLGLPLQAGVFVVRVRSVTGFALVRHLRLRAAARYVDRDYFAAMAMDLAVGADRDAVDAARDPNARQRARERLLKVVRVQ